MQAVGKRLLRAVARNCAEPELCSCNERRRKEEVESHTDQDLRNASNSAREEIFRRLEPPALLLFQFYSRHVFLNFCVAPRPITD